VSRAPRVQKSDIDMELKAEELKRILDEQSKSSSLDEIGEMMDEVVDPIRDLQHPDDTDPEPK